MLQLNKCYYYVLSFLHQNYFRYFQFKTSVNSTLKRFPLKMNQIEKKEVGEEIDIYVTPTNFKQLLYFRHYYKNYIQISSLKTTLL